MNLPGYDAWLEAPYVRQNDDTIEDEGIQLLQSAAAYLKPRADADEDEQLIGDFEAYEILQGAIHDVIEMYDCRFCGHFTGKKNTYCSHGCAKADAEGL